MNGQSENDLHWDRLMDLSVGGFKGIQHDLQFE